MSAHVTKCIFFGYDNQTKAYKCYNPFVKMIMISRYVHFNKNYLLGKGLDQSENNLSQNLESSNFHLQSHPFNHEANYSAQLRPFQQEVIFSPQREEVIPTQEVVPISSRKEVMSILEFLSS
jgi:hypothetical protein